MKIGIIGTGNMGKTLGLRWAALRHDVFFGSSDLSKARTIASESGSQAGSLDEAAAFGDIILYTVRDLRPSKLLTSAHVLSGKILIDCNNRALRNGSEEAFIPGAASHAEMIASDVNGVRVVKAFNTIAHRVIELSRDVLDPHHISVFLCSDDPQAKNAVKTLAEDLGFVGIDCGKLRDSRMVEALFGFVSFQIGTMGLGPFATLSVKVLPHA